ncbi:MAG: DUF1549 domain-containing protein, partial [Planctomycetaceae bacterium]|nr:DUF1549 domain-containing protein [Planctomycetaceae bacterium]
MIASWGSCLILLVGWSWLLLYGGETKADESPAIEKRLNFEEDIVPILKTHCFDCHGKAVQKAGLDLRRRFTIIKGGQSGSALTPNKPDDSLLLEMVINGSMPPEDNRPLDENQIRTLKAWVKNGAPIRGDKEAPLEDTGNGAQVTLEDREFWAFQPPSRPPVPQVKAIERVRTTVDAFLLSKLESKKASFNPDASKLTLLRRVYFDVLGLPPTPQEIEDFVSDCSPDAYERLVDRLLASPRYGERWGRHRLDVARYADSCGLANDYQRGSAWRYRDYVVRSFNADKPYDQFIMEQLAGDELDPHDPEMLVAVGFLRMGAWERTGMEVPKVARQRFLDDVTDTVGQVFLGHMLQCARCHDHKFDP